MMSFGQKIHPLNFEYAKEMSTVGGALEIKGKSFQARILCAEITESCTRLSFDNSNVADKQHRSDAVVEALRPGKSVAAMTSAAGFKTPACEITASGGRLKIAFSDGTILETVAEGIGFNGEAMILHFDTTAATGFYGFGERTKRFNKAGESMDFHTIDVGAVYPLTLDRDDYDPAYMSIPLAIIRTGGNYIGLYLDNPERLVFDAGHMEPGHLILQSLAGNNDLYLIQGPSLKDVVRNFSVLTGRAEVPPVWALGNHQCRWGYKTAAEFRALKTNFQKFDVPVSALWYDIDYMDEYRVFTWDLIDVPDPHALNSELKEVGIRSVAICDPGVKLDPGYSVYESGKQRDVFCKTISGLDYVGRVWPGDTVFPDFPKEEARKWWAEHLSDFFVRSALDGAWLDMNEPATGWSSYDEMRFLGGTVAHGPYHNQYGHFMAKASRLAFEKMDPNARSFLLTRSGFAGTQRYSAVWTGDNASNWRHLRMSIPCTINLGLSGVAFNGPDVGGFFGHTDEELLTRWYQAGFLFPFFRNHSTNHTKEQEPWNFGTPCLARIRDAIYTRYRLMPYLYQCFFAHHLTGDPVLRPLLYEFNEARFENVGDQFLVGDYLLFAPILESCSEGRCIVERGTSRCQRYVALPEGWWFDLMRGEWIAGGGVVQCAASLDEVPIFVRDGAIIPYFNGKFCNGEMPLEKVELHVFVREQTGRLNYYTDDRKTRQYLTGGYNTVRITASIDVEKADMRLDEIGAYEKGTVTFEPVFYGQRIGSVTIEANGEREVRELSASTRRWVGTNVAVMA